MNRNLFDEIKKLNAGDLVRVEWYDASLGKSLAQGRDVDVAVKSWGIFIGVLGDRNRHLILAQNNFRYADGIYDLDYTAIPLNWSVNVTALMRNHIQSEEAKELLKSFLVGGRSSSTRRKRQEQKRNHNG